VLYLPKGVEVYEIDGPFFFGIANKFDEKMRIIGDRPAVRIIRMRESSVYRCYRVNNLETLCRNSRKEKIEVILIRCEGKNVRESLNKSAIPQLIGEENICSNIHLQSRRAKVLIDEKQKEKI